VQKKKSIFYIKSFNFNFKRKEKKKGKRWSGLPTNVHTLSAKEKVGKFKKRGKSLSGEIWEIHVPFKKGWQKFEWRNMGNSCAFQKRVAKV